MLGAWKGCYMFACIGRICLTGGASSVKDVDELGSVGAEGRGGEMLTWSDTYNLILISL